jgi:hypothetical protein
MQQSGSILVARPSLGWAHAGHIDRTSYFAAGAMPKDIDRKW